ncbi:hypothetical protein ACFYOY_00310 [Streptomyces sp. NPDC007875]|uniref:hypothetical protein n=1 Tax=Streptomyces sp. NPDC007875 TaxID=3364783 RepID=UPI00369E8845
MYTMSRTGDGLEERGRWLRRAAQSRDVKANLVLGRALRDRNSPQEAERCLRVAAEDDGQQWVEPLDLVETEAGLGPRHQACLALVALLAAQGRLDEANQWRGRAKRVRNMEAAVNRAFFRRSAGETVVVTAVVATAVVPFVQALMSKAAEDAYGQARALVQRMLRRPPAQREADNGAMLLIADDPDAHITLCLWSDVSDEALRALASLNLDELTAQRPDRGRIRLVWNEAHSRWQIRGDQQDQ